MKKKMKAITDRIRSVSQIFVDNVHIVDFDKIYNLDQKNLVNCLAFNKSKTIASLFIFFCSGVKVMKIK